MLTEMMKALTNPCCSDRLQKSDIRITELANLAVSQIVPKNPMQALVDASQPLRSGSMDLSIPALIAVMQQARSISLQFRQALGSAHRSALIV